MHGDVMLLDFIQYEKTTLAVFFVQTLMTRVASMGIRMMFLPLLVYARNGEFLAI